MSDPGAEGRPSEESDSAQTEEPSLDPAGRPIYKGAPLDAECGPGLGCFWVQVITLVTLLVLTPLTVILAFPSWVSAALLILTLAILFFVGQTTIFLLRLVAADRRAARRVPRSTSARRTVGQLEDEATAHPSHPDDVAPPSDEDHAPPR